MWGRGGTLPSKLSSSYTPLSSCEVGGAGGSGAESGWEGGNGSMTPPCGGPPTDDGRAGTATWR